MNKLLLFACIQLVAFKLFAGIENEQLLFKYESPKKAFCCNWFPHKELERKPSPFHHLFVEGSGLDKYDQCTNSMTRDLECREKRIAYDSHFGSFWKGYEKESAEVSCLFLEPCDVVMRTPNGDFTFTQNDLEGLLVKTIDMLPIRKEITDFEYCDRAGIPSYGPKDLLNLLRTFAEHKKPFVLGISHNGQHWPVPVDSVEVFHFERSRDGCNFYRCKMMGPTGEYPVYFFQKKGPYDYILEEGWIDEEHFFNEEENSELEAGDRLPELSFIEEIEATANLTQEESWPQIDDPNVVNPRFVFSLLRDASAW